MSNHAYQRASDVIPESVCMCGKHWFHSEHFDGNRTQSYKAIDGLRQLHATGSSMSGVRHYVDLATAQPEPEPNLPTPPKFTSTAEADRWLEQQAHPKVTVSEKPSHNLPRDRNPASAMPPGTRTRTVVVAGNYDQAKHWMERHAFQPSASIVITPGSGIHALHGIRSANVYYVGTWDEMSTAQSDDLFIALKTVNARHLTEDGFPVATGKRGILNVESRAVRFPYSIESGA